MTRSAISYMLNLLDMVLTLRAMECGVAELNPLMRNVPFMVFYKTVIIGALLWWLSRREEGAARVGRNVIMLWYGLVTMWHVVNGIL